MPSSSTTDRRTRPRSSTTWGPRPRLISSTRRTRGWRARARARATMRCSPPDRSPARRPRRSARAGKRSTARAVSAATARPPAADGQAQVLGHRQLGEQRPLLGDARHAPAGGGVGPARRAAPVPATRTSPAERGRAPATASTVVVLPAPLRPRRATISPGADGEVDAVHHVGAAVPGGQAARPRAPAARPAARAPTPRRQPGRRPPVAARGRRPAPRGRPAGRPAGPVAMTRPRSRTVTSSHTSSTRARSWSTRRTAAPSSASRRRRRPRAWRPAGSRPAAGSSRSSTVGRPATARVRATSRRWALDSCDGSRSTAPPRPPISPAHSAPPPGRLGRHQQVLAHGEVLEQLQRLERAAQAEAGPAVGGQPLDRPARRATMRPDGGRHEAGEGVDHRRLARPVGTDEAGDGARPQVEVDVGHRRHRPEPHGQAPHLQSAHRAPAPTGPGPRSPGAGGWPPAMRPEAADAGAGTCPSTTVKTSPLGHQQPARPGRPRDAGDPAQVGGGQVGQRHEHAEGAERQPALAVAEEGAAQPGHEGGQGEGGQLGGGEVDAAGGRRPLVGPHGQEPPPEATPAQGGHAQRHRRPAPPAPPARSRPAPGPAHAGQLRHPGALEAAGEGRALEHRLLHRHRRGQGDHGQAQSPQAQGGQARRPRPTTAASAAATSGATGKGTSHADGQLGQGEPGHAGEGHLGQRDLAHVPGQHHQRQADHGPDQAVDQAQPVLAARARSSPSRAPDHADRGPPPRPSGPGGQRAGAARPAPPGPGCARRRGRGRRGSPPAAAPPARPPGGSTRSRPAA